MSESRVHVSPSELSDGQGCLYSEPTGTLSSITSKNTSQHHLLQLQVSEIALKSIRTSRLFPTGTVPKMLSLDCSKNEQKTSCHWTAPNLPKSSIFLLQNLALRGVPRSILGRKGPVLVTICGQVLKIKIVCSQSRHQLQPSPLQEGLFRERLSLSLFPRACLGLRLDFFFLE